MSWISVKDRMPKADGFPVLCRVRDSSAMGAITIVAYPPYGPYPKEWTLDLPDRDYSRRVSTDLVTHWMPLLAPPPSKSV